MGVRTTMTAKEAGKYIGISYWKILELTKQRQIPFSQVGGRKLFRKDTLDKWMKQLEEKSVESEVAATETDNDYGKLRKIF